MEPSVVGKTLGRYKIIDPRGAGGMGKVYRPEDKRRVAALR